LPERRWLVWSDLGRRVAARVGAMRSGQSPARRVLGGRDRANRVARGAGGRGRPRVVRRGRRRRGRWRWGGGGGRVVRRGEGGGAEQGERGIAVLAFDGAAVQVGPARIVGRELGGAGEAIDGRAIESVDVEDLPELAPGGGRTRSAADRLLGFFDRGDHHGVQ